ncbi:MAG: hypothetical protein IT376_07465 [Polyangiaceae bacterium]|nr:hypothetical protein [Polyangiaceae bacterium]
MIRRGAWALAAVVAASAGGARGAVAAPQPKRNAVTYEPFAIGSRGVAVGYERLVAPRWSVGGGLGVWSSARGDYSSLGLAVRGEVRLWLAGREVFANTHGLAGPFLGFSLDAARTALRDERRDRDLGAAYTSSELVRLGHRFVVLGVQELTPALGVGLAHDVDAQGRLAATSRVVPFSLALSVGWVF